MRAVGQYASHGQKIWPRHNLIITILLRSGMKRIQYGQPDTPLLRRTVVTIVIQVHVGGPHRLILKLI